jgi:5-methylcytosine-specific restriction enzyme subunit McrC
MAADIDTTAEVRSESIPIRNLYYLLCYAWDYLRQGLPVPMPAGECENLVNLFALILARGIRHEVRRGIHREYVEFTEETPRIRGRLGLLESLGRQTWLNGRMVCTFDELSHDVLANRILRATGDRLLRDPALTHGNRAILREELKWLVDVTPLRIEGRHFRQTRVHRRNRTYRFLLNLCELLHRQSLPGETDARSRDRLLRSILRDEITLCHLFESFVRNFYAEHLRDCTVAQRTVAWSGFGLDEDSQRCLPSLQTDVTIDGPDRRLILDCKFYAEALKGGRYSEKVIGAHLFQLLTYLQNAERTQAGWGEGMKPRGVLLYPAVRRSFDFRYELLGYSVRVCSVDLDRSWEEIENQLFRIVDATADLSMM